MLEHLNSFKQVYYIRCCERNSLVLKASLNKMCQNRDNDLFVFVLQLQTKEFCTYVIWTALVNVLADVHFVDVLSS